MKVLVNGELVIELSDTKKKVIKSDIHDNVFEEDMKRRVHWVLNHKYERCMERLRNEWLPKLKTKYDVIPTNDDALAELIFSQPDYKSRSQREAQ